MAASSGGDTDTIASIAGSLFGAACGASWIPKRWLECLEQREWIESDALSLYDLFNSFCC